MDVYFGDVGAEGVVTPRTRGFKHTGELACSPLPARDWRNSVQIQVFRIAEAEVLPLLPFYVTTQGLWTPFQEPEGQDTSAQPLKINTHFYLWSGLGFWFLVFGFW